MMDQLKLKAGLLSLLKLVDANEATNSKQTAFQKHIAASKPTKKQQARQMIEAFWAKKYPGF